MWNLSGCGLGWACMGASVPKNGNNRPLSLPVGKLSPPSFCAALRLLVSWIMSSTELLPKQRQLMEGGCEMQPPWKFSPDPRSVIGGGGPYHSHKSLLWYQPAGLACVKSSLNYFKDGSY